MSLFRVPEHGRRHVISWLKKAVYVIELLYPGTLQRAHLLNVSAFVSVLIPSFNVAMSGIELGSTYVPKQCQIPVNYCDLELRSQMLQKY